MHCMYDMISSYIKIDEVLHLYLINYRVQQNSCLTDGLGLFAFPCTDLNIH